MPNNLGLKYNRQTVSMMTIGEHPRPQLGIAHPSFVEQRAQAAAYWGGTPSPRQHTANTINQALPARAQTILSYQLTDDERAQVNGGLGPLAQSRRS